MKAPAPEPSVPPPASRTMAAALSEAIRADIVKGNLAAGQKLGIKALAERYGAGAIPVREALSRLANTGFVDAEDQRGFRVSAMSAAQLRDITDTRIFIEIEAVRRSILAGGLAWEEQVVVTSHRMRRVPFYLPGNQVVSPEWQRAHSAFHHALGAACPSAWLQQLAAMLREQTERYQNMSVAPLPGTARKTKPAKRDIGGEHEAITRAALARDADTACALLAQHIRHTSDIVLAQQPQQQPPRAK